MHFQIEPSNGIPIYEQISRQIKFGVANRSLSPGQTVPSVRELASQLVVNPNTVARAYRDLQAEGVLNQLRGVGLEVSQEAATICKNMKLELVRTRLHSVVDEALAHQVTPDELRGMLEEEFMLPRV